MKQLVFTLIGLLGMLGGFAQDIAGQWNGLLDIQGTKLRIVFHISKTEAGYSATLDSPDQGANGIATNPTTFEQNVLEIKIKDLKAEYWGTLAEGNTIKGTFTQMGQSFPLDLGREAIAKPVAIRPQEPKKIKYKAEEISFVNKPAGINLAGTLTMPKQKGTFPAVILISGSGPQNRDEELLGHKPFLILADHLTKNGVAVLRFDDRGVGKSEGDFQAATSRDFASDVQAAFEYLRTRPEINPKQIGLVGHSEGGLIAPMVAAANKDVGFIVLLAGPGMKGGDIIVAQQQLIARAEGSKEADIRQTAGITQKLVNLVGETQDLEKLKTLMTNFLDSVVKTLPAGTIPPGMSKEEYVKVQVDAFATPWMQFFITYNPVESLAQLSCPVLALNGEKDLQVPCKQNLEIIEKTLAQSGNKSVTTKALPNLNHLFQVCKTGSPSEYANIEQTMAPLALNEISAWIKQQTKK